MYFFNIYDNVYVIGSVDFIGDMLVILGLDGFFFGGFVCLVIVIFVDFWKLGQLWVGDIFCFVVVI